MFCGNSRKYKGKNKNGYYKAPLNLLQLATHQRNFQGTDVAGGHFVSLREVVVAQRSLISFQDSEPVDQATKVLKTEEVILTSLLDNEDIVGASLERLSKLRPTTADLLKSDVCSVLMNLVRPRYAGGTQLGIMCRNLLRSFESVCKSSSNYDSPTLQLTGCPEEPQDINNIFGANRGDPLSACLNNLCDGNSFYD